MRHSKLFLPFIILATLVFVLSCNKKDDFDNTPYQPERLKELMPMQVGKYITYRLDSTVFTNFGRNEEVHSYIIKHVVDAETTDNLGRPAYRILSYIRDTAGNVNAWKPHGTISVIQTDKQVETIEDNFRFIRLQIPTVLNYTWKGNTYLPDNPYGALFTMSNDDAMKDWDYIYDNIEQSADIEGTAYDSVYTVLQVDESDNLPVTPATIVASRSLAIDKYAANIGLVYRDFIMWEYQGGTGGGVYNGFGIKMWIIDHN